jgi:hypothetical protein
MRMRRVYTSTAHFRAPYDTPNISFAGLGLDHSAYDTNKWPAGRSYWTTHFYRAPYQAGYYQSGALRGLGSSPMLPPSAAPALSPAGMPSSIREYAMTGKPPSAIGRDLVTVANQVPRWAYFGIALGAGWMAWRAWKAARPKG